LTFAVLPDRFPPLGAAAAGTFPPSVLVAVRPARKERFVPDEPTQEQPRRRRPVLLAMLAAAALLVALAGSGAAGSGGSAGSSERVSPGAPAADQQGQQGLTRRGRHCHHDRDRQGPQQQPSDQPPV
jgi:hypothetical protein